MGASKSPCPKSFLSANTGQIRRAKVPANNPANLPELSVTFIYILLQMGLIREHRETVDQIRKEHDEELFKIRGEQALPVQYHVEKIQQVNHK